MSEFDRVIGYEEIKTELKMFSDVLKNEERYRRLGVKFPSGLLLDGNPGIGKTLMAECFIKEVGCKVFRLRKEKPNGDFVNEIKKVYEEAKKAPPSIVFLDDMDKFANEDNEHPNAEEYVTVQSCIDECKGKGVFTLATTNNRFLLPDSLRRPGRFDKIIDVYDPRGEDFKKIMTHFLKGKRVSEDLDIEEIERLMESNTTARLETIINEAGIYAGFKGRDIIKRSDIIKACMRMEYAYPIRFEEGLDEEGRHIAVHEAGHAVVSEILNPGSVNYVSVFRNSGEIKGITKLKEKWYYNTTLSMCEQNAIQAFGGKAASEVVYGISDMGSHADIAEAMDSINCYISNNSTFGFDTSCLGEPSQIVLESRNRRVSYESDRLLCVAREIIAKNREFLDVMVEELVEKEILTFRDIKRINEKVYSPR